LYSPIFIKFITVYFYYLKIILIYIFFTIACFGKCEVIPSFDGIKHAVKNLSRSDQRFVSLSFDDGPSSKTTSSILKILDQYNVKGTFFLTGTNASSFPDLVNQIAQGGHEIANHSMSHKNLVRISSERQKREVEDASLIIERITGKKPKWFRPPYGNMNQSLEKILTQKKLKPVLWSVDPQDWKDLPVNTIVKSVINNLHNGAIILLHDCHANTVKALPEIIKQIKALNYEIVTVDQWSSLACDSKKRIPDYNKETS
jgi:peptidoglycan/xylan/chitin deacetylase (PgdA/CDA1 family)